MKLMIFAIDALPPDVLFNNINEYPNIKKLKENGMYCQYDSYTYGYGSRDNWVSLYTGLTPQQHGVINNQYKDEKRYPNMNDYKEREPFWKMLNKQGLKVGMIKGLATTPPDNIDGYMISGEINYDADAEIIDEYYSLNPVVTNKDRYILKYINTNLEKQPVPRSEEYFGYRWNEIKESPQLLNGILKDDYFHEAVEYLKSNLEYYKKDIINLQDNSPVDVCFFYTQLIDYISHFQSHDLEKKEIKKAIKIIDEFIGMVISKINPDNVLILSDHGIKGWQESLGNSPVKLQREMFGLRDSAIWLENGAIIIKARNKGFLSACHDIKGTFIISGKDIKTGKVKDMRTIDFYPTLLEMFDVKIPSHRKGFVLDVFKNKKIVNEDKFITNSGNNTINIGIIQNIDIPAFNKVVNEVFLNNRFCNIKVLGEEKYKETFLYNPRIDEFIGIKNKKINKHDLQNFDKVILPYKNSLTGEVNFYEV
ncbi:alkaline phosphatase family protein [Clostridium niameyense]|uniref:alkaline phosphatase family protein n=1 Tax=Clostridium niameyense TaxID=1622073 RepID=UPI00067E8E85|nr:alkaline phosphatase family protein [Clostridium niameyense]